MFLSFVIPCYGSELTVNGVVEEICCKMSEKRQFDYEIIAVNDCSPDNVLEVLKKLASVNSRLKVIDFSKNFGKSSAVLAGYAFVSGDIIINLDDDGQCPLDRLWDLIEPLNQGYDAAYAKYSVKKQSKIKNYGSKINSIMAECFIGKPKNLHISNFSAFKRFIVDEMILYKNPYPYSSGLVLRATSNVANVEMEERERVAGVGHFTLKKSISLWLNGFTAFSIKPLRFATIMGLISAGIGFIFAIYVILRKIIYPNIAAGYSSLMSVLLFIGGLIMVCLGLIGEYVGRIYISLNNSPQYVIRQTFNVVKK